MPKESKRVRALRAEYGARNQQLRAMGYENYSKYLESPLWQRIRALVLRDGRVCAGGCGRMATQVHHGDYSRETLEGHNLTDLYPVCSGCHFRIEFTGAGRKVPPSKATRTLKKARRRKGKFKRRTQKVSNAAKRDPAVAIQERIDNRNAATETYEDYKRRQKLWKHPRKRGKGHKSP